MTKEPTHFDTSGRVHMVDVSEKAVTTRVATAEGFVHMQPETARLIQEAGLRKGDVLQVARLAGIGGAKLTPLLIPLCHAIPIEGASVELAFVDESRLRIEATVRTSGKTGVEMEALSAVTTAALCVYDMCKAVDRGMTIGPIQLVEKTGGQSGTYVRAPRP